MLGIRLDVCPLSAPAVIGIGVVYPVARGPVPSTLQSIYQAAVYRNAADGDAPQGFKGAGLDEVFRAMI